MAAIGEELRITMGVLREGGIELGRQLHRTAGIANEGERFAVVGAEENFAAWSPGSILESRKHGDNAGRSASGADLFQFAVGKEGQPLGVRGPKRCGGAFSAGENMSVH